MRIFRGINNRVRRLRKAVSEILHAAGIAKEQSGKSRITQVWELARLRVGPGKLRPADYYGNRLFSSDYTEISSKLAFAGDVKNREIDRQLNHPHWKAIADSKIVTMSFLSGLGFPVVNTHAMYRPGGRSAPSLRCLATSDELTQFLRTELPFPAFVKPVSSSRGYGSFRLHSYNTAADSLVDHTDSSIPIATFVETIDQFHFTPRYGYLFQQVIKQHPVLEEIYGLTVGTVRMIVALDSRDGPFLHGIMLRIPLGQLVVDNLRGGTSGNLAGAVDFTTGEILRVTSGIGVNEKLVTEHPVSGKPLVGVRLPLWEECVDTVFRAATFLPGLKFQRWDVAIGPDGPILIEVNYNGSASMWQSLKHRGMLDDRFRDFLERNAERQ